MRTIIRGDTVTIITATAMEGAMDIGGETGL
jgi:hypothetical protein